MSRTIRIGTRKSMLALAQSELVAEALKSVQPGLNIEFVTKVTEGDRILNKPLLEFGGKGVFVTEFEQALLRGEIDFAVHSAKDLPMELEDGLAIVSVPPREDPRDVLVTPVGADFSGRKEIVIGTSSLRRKLQIEALAEKLWPGLEVRCENIRGNVQTRLGKLEEGLYDAIILAAAGLKRLGIVRGEEKCQDTGNPTCSSPVRKYLEADSELMNPIEYTEVNGRYQFDFFSCDDFIPAGGQGIMAVEGRTEDSLLGLVERIQDEEARTCLALERKILKLLDAGCHEPIGVYSSLKAGLLTVSGISRRGEETKRIHMSGSISEMGLLAERAAKGLR